MKDIHDETALDMYGKYDEFADASKNVLCSKIKQQQKEKVKSKRITFTPFSAWSSSISSEKTKRKLEAP